MRERKKQKTVEHVNEYSKKTDLILFRYIS